MWLSKWFTRKKSAEGFKVDFNNEVELPRGAERVLWHHPAGVGKMLLRPEHLTIRPMPRGVSYLDYKTSQPSAVFGDALILNALLAPYREKETNLTVKSVEDILKDFSGQIFFLGTAFEGIYEGKSTLCFAYLNWKTHQPALRYMCPGHHPINHTVNCCALHIEAPLALTS